MLSGPAAPCARTHKNGFPETCAAGADEFQIVVPHTKAADALRGAEKIGLAIADADVPGCDSVTVSVAVGQLTGQEWPDALVVRVVTALALAKRAGGNWVESALY